MGTTADRIIEAVASQDVIDAAADPPHRAVERLLYKAPALARVLHGDWLGHPLHAAMVSLPVGAFTTGFALDAAGIVGGTKKLQRGADVATAIGLAGALGAAVAGLADFSTTRGGAKRAAFVHGAANVAASSLYGASLVLRSLRMRRLGIALSSAGFGLLMASSWLGGELAYRFGIGVRPEALRQAARGAPATARGETSPPQVEQELAR